MTLTQTLRFSPDEFHGKRIAISVEEGHIVDVDIVPSDWDEAPPSTHGLSGNLTMLGTPAEPYDAGGAALGYTIAHEVYGDETRENLYTVAFGDDVRQTFDGDRTFNIAFPAEGLPGRYPDAYSFSVVVDFDDAYYDDEDAA